MSIIQPAKNNIAIKNNPIIIDSPNPIEKFGLKILVESPDKSAELTKDCDQKGIIVKRKIKIGTATDKTLSFIFLAFKNRNGTNNNGYNLNEIAKPKNTDAFNNFSFLRYKNAINVSNTAYKSIFENA